MKLQTRLRAALTIMMATGLTCLAEDQNTEAKADANSQTVQIQAANIEYDAENKEIKATGNVVITSPRDTVKGDKVVIKTDEKAKTDTERQAVQIQADKIESNVPANEIAFSGNVVMTMKDGSTVKGSKIVIKTDESAAVISSGVKRDVKSDKNEEK